jgi:hypothetical protein
MNRTERKRQRQREKRLANEPMVLRFQFSPIALRFAGPVINTDIWVADSHAQSLTAAGQAIPERVRCRFLIDSGAYCTIVKHHIAETAGLKLINTSSPVRGVGEDDTGRTYFGRILFVLRSSVDPNATHIIAVETEITSAALAHATHFDGLIGRDVLSFFDFRYNGKDGEVVMKYRGPRGDANILY